MAKTIKTLPKRLPLVFKYTDKKDRKMVSIRLPEALIAELKGISEDTGHNVTEIIQFALDQYCQLQGKSRK